MDALELTMKCSKLLKRPYSTSTTNDDSTTNSQIILNPSPTVGDGSCLSTSFSDNDFEISRLTTKEGLSTYFFFSFKLISFFVFYRR
jgi:hypothetical protein